MKARKKTKLVQGVGENDASYPVNITAVVCGRQKIIWVCPIYDSWHRMLNRCYSAKLHARHPTYANCIVSPAWLSFSVFRAWMMTQDWEGKSLDKDLLSPSGKVYSPDTCVFIPPALNNFMCDSGATRGKWPIGVCWNKAAGKFKASCCDPFIGKQEFLGLFTDPAEAHEKWRQRKHQHACTYADMQTDPRIAEALRARYATKGEAK